MNLIVDTGNSRTKIALFKENTLVQKAWVDDENDVRLFINHQKVKNIIYSRVGNNTNSFNEYLNQLAPVHYFSYRSKLPFINLYKTQETLGVDRMAVIAGAILKFKNKNVLIIDAGTCITYDFVNENSEYHGGAISLGLEMRFKALNTFTKSLPFIEPQPNFNQLIGDTTKNSILSGVQLGILAEVKDQIQAYLALYPDLQVLICGGDHSFFDTSLKNSIFANLIETAPDLVLHGLNSLLQIQDDYSAA